MQFARRAVEGECDVLPRREPRRFDRLEHHGNRFLVALEIGGEATFVAHAGAQLPLHEHFLERVKHLRAHPQPVAERFGAHRNDHVLLEIHRIGRVRAAVQNVHHRHRHHAGERSTQVAPQRESEFARARARDGHRHGKDGVGAEVGLVWRAIHLDERGVDAHLVGRVCPSERRRDGLLDVLHREQHALATVARRVVVAQLDGLVLARAGATRHRRASDDATFQHDVGFDGGVAAAVEDFAGVDVGDDGGH